MRNEFPEPIDPAAWPFDAPLLRIHAVWPFCERCRYVISIAYQQQFVADKTTHDNFQSYILYRTTADLDMGIERKCWICLRAAEKQYDKYLMPIVFNIYVYPSVSGGESLPEISIFPHYVGYPDPESDALRLSLAKADDDSLPSRLYKTSKQHTRHKDDPQVWRYLRDQLDICTASHSVCNTESSWAPTRLVEIGRLGQATRHRVVLTKELTEKKPYISLSHRWGDNLTLRLTKHTYDKYSREIPVEELPKKYNDAAVAAQKLKVEYLWIDSLCIIQDDPVDWDKESATMYQVYWNAFCNLSAASASAEDEGLFYERSRSLHLPQVVTIEVPYLTGHQNLQFMLTEHGRDNSWFKKLDDEPLYSRAWVFQERLLARRNISFTRDLVYFECAGAITSEIDEVLPLQSAGFRAMNQIWNERAFSPFSMRNLPGGQDPNQCWRHIVRYYSRCELTKPTDKLVALSGVARAFHAHIKSDYMAGMWKNTISQDLAWERAYDTDEDFAPGDAGYLAPSWSWASLYHTEVSISRFIGTRGELQLATCEEVTTTLHGTDPFGRVRDGTLRLHCFAVPLGTPRQARNPSLFPNYERIAIFAMRGFFNQSFVITYKVDRFIPFVSVPEGDPEPAYYAVPLLTTGPKTLVSLLLEKLSPGEERYRRVGRIEAHEWGLEDKDDGTGLPTMFQSYISRGVRCSICRGLARMMEVIKGPKDADGKRCITIV